MTGWLVRSLCQITAERARMRWRIRAVTPSGVRPPWCSRSSWPLKVPLTDSMVWRSGLKNWADGPRGRPPELKPRARQRARPCLAAGNGGFTGALTAYSLTFTTRCQPAGPGDRGFCGTAGVPGEGARGP